MALPISTRDVIRAMSDATGVSEEKLVVLAVTTVALATVRLAFRAADWLLNFDMEV